MLGSGGIFDLNYIFVLIVVHVELWIAGDRCALIRSGSELLHTHPLAPLGETYLMAEIYCCYGILMGLLGCEAQALDLVVVSQRETDLLVRDPEPDSTDAFTMPRFDAHDACFC